MVDTDDAINKQLSVTIPFHKVKLYTTTGDGYFYCGILGVDTLTLAGADKVDTALFRISVLEERLDPAKIQVRAKQSSRSAAMPHRRTAVHCHVSHTPPPHR